MMSPDTCDDHSAHARAIYISEDSFIFFTLSSDILLVNIYSYVVKSGYLPPSLPRLSGLVIGCYLAASVTLVA